MSFLNRFTNLMAGKPTKVKIKKPRPPKPKKTISKIRLAEIETRAREIIVEAKDKAFEVKRQADLQAQTIFKEAQVLKEKSLKQAAEIDRRLGSVEQREKSTRSQEARLKGEFSKIDQIKKDQLSKLERIANLKKEEARDLIIKAYEKRMTRDIAQIITEAEEKAKAEAETKAKEILIEAMRHGATDYVAEYTVSLVKVADEDMKGRVIGREGRNIRTFEKVTGVEVDLDEAGVIRLSCFDPVRREIARVALEKLIADGRIQPSRIEEIVKRVKQEIDRVIHQEGEKLCHAVKVFNLPREIVDMLGRFKYRFSYGALGDHVNLGSRLEGLNKMYGTEVLIGENTARMVNDSFLLREVDYVRVQGKEKPVRFYELLGILTTVLPEEMKQAFSYYSSGLEAYRSKKWEDAIDLFEKGQKLYSEDKSFQVMALRCRIYQRDPPKGEWDGVFRERRK